MTSRKCKWIGALLVLPALAAASEPAEDGASTLVTPASTQAAPAHMSFDLKAETVQNILRIEAERSDEPLLDDAVARDEKLRRIQFRAPRRAHHVDCDTWDCVAYTADNDALYTFPRDTGNGLDNWLSCQDTNNLMTTFERYDLCRGVRIGLSKARP